MVLMKTTNKLPANWHETERLRATHRKAESIADFVKMHHIDADVVLFMFQGELTYGCRIPDPIAAADSDRSEIVFTFFAAKSYLGY